MAINIRRVGEVADNSVTSVKLADGAVDLSTAKVVGQVPTSKIEDGAIIETKLTDLSVSTQKLADNAITLAKADNDIRLKHYTGDETEVSVTGITEVIVKEFTILKKPLVFDSKTIRVILTLKTSDILYTATFKIYIDSEATARLTLTSTSSTYEMLSGDFAIDDLTAGRHTVQMTLNSSDASGIAYNDLIDCMVIQ